MESVELKPCPACGELVTIEYYLCFNEPHFFLIECGTCKGVNIRDLDKQQCAIRWNALPRELEWTKEPPKEEGWYWAMDRSGYIELVEVVVYDYEVCTTLVFETGDEEGNSIEDYTMWAGPIPMPHEKD